MEAFMKKTVLALLIFATALGSAAAVGFDILSYPAPLEGGNILVDLGLGYSNWGSHSGWKMKIPPLVATAEYCLPIPVPISVGGLFSYARYGNSYTYMGNHTWNHNYFIFAGRANWHFGFDISWLDLYAGMNIGYRYYSVKYDGPNKGWADDWYTSSYSGLYWGTQAGAHFYFTNFIGAVAEVGYPIYAKAGVALKF